MRKGKRRRELTKEEWEAFAEKLSDSLRMQRECWATMLETVNIASAEFMRNAIKKAQSMKFKANDICASQHGYDFSDKIFYGSRWTNV